MSYLDIKEGQRLQLTEKFLDSVQGNYSFDIQISSVLTEMPDIGLNVAFYPVKNDMKKYLIIMEKNHIKIILNGVLLNRNCWN